MACEDEEACEDRVDLSCEAKRASGDGLPVSEAIAECDEEAFNLSSRCTSRLGDVFVKAAGSLRSFAGPVSLDLVFFCDFFATCGGSLDPTM